MRSKADAKSAEYKDLYEKQKQEAEQAADEEAKAFGNEEMISTTTPDETLLHKADKIQERADKREGVKRSNAEWWEWIKGGMNSAPATTPQTTPQQPITTTPPQTEAEGGTTPQTTTTTTSKEVDFDINKDGVVDNKETVIGITKQDNQRRMDALKVYQEAQAKGLSAYQTLLKDSFKRKEEVAKKQERNARSQAIANALGSLVNVITAGAIAKRNGNIPIVAEYDDTADSALRKSIEQRYALGNENENLLMKLEQERMKHEADIAKQNYDQTIASIDAETKAKIAPIAQQIALDEYEKKAEIRANAQKDVRTHAGEVQKDVNAEKPNKGNTSKKRVYTKIENEFISTVNANKTKSSVNKDAYGNKKTTTTNRTLGPAEKDRFADIATGLEKAFTKSGKFDKDKFSTAMSVYNEVWVKMPTMESAIFDDKLRTFIANAINEGNDKGTIIAKIKANYKL